MYKHQYGFQHGISTKNNLILETNFIRKALNSGNYCIGIFLDLRKAFDTCSHDILLTKLSKLGVNGTALQWFHSYLTGRHQKVEINVTFLAVQQLTVASSKAVYFAPCSFYVTSTTFTVPLSLQPFCLPMTRLALLSIVTLTP
jgi:sarcosine oxidase/L-pipecolate oxidase